MEIPKRRPTTEEIDNVYNRLTAEPHTAGYVSKQLSMDYALAEDILGHLAAFGVAKEDVRSSPPTYKPADIPEQGRSKKLDFMKSVAAKSTTSPSMLSDSDIAEFQRWLGE